MDNARGTIIEEAASYCDNCKYKEDKTCPQLKMPHGLSTVDPVVCKVNGEIAESVKAIYGIEKIETEPKSFGDMNATRQKYIAVYNQEILDLDTRIHWYRLMLSPFMKTIAGQAEAHTYFTM
jgi:hypothetical protein